MPQSTNHVLRPALAADCPALERLIAISARGLSRGDYTEKEIEAAVTYIFGVDSELIADSTYFVVEQNDQYRACGGWSRRRTLFGGDQYAGRETGFLDPRTEPAKIRAFFVHPDHARRGIGATLLRHCEEQAKTYGFSEIEMMATLPGINLYKAFGYQTGALVTLTTPDGTGVRFMPMRKQL